MNGKIEYPHYSSNPLNPNDWNTSTKGTIRSGFYLNYQKGFHIFATRKDAREVAKRSSNRVVKKVEFDNVVAIGIETQYGQVDRKTIVAKKMRIVGR